MASAHPILCVFAVLIHLIHVHLPHLPLTVTLPAFVITFIAVLTMLPLYTIEANLGHAIHVHQPILIDMLRAVVLAITVIVTAVRHIIMSIIHRSLPNELTHANRTAQWPSPLRPIPVLISIRHATNAHDGIA